MDPKLNSVKEKMLKAIQLIREDIATIRTGRANPLLVENIVVSAYENSQKLKVKEMATITTDGARTLVIAPFDPTVIKDLERGINSANLGFSAVVDGNIVRISLPPLTEERRQEYIKMVGTKIEGGRVMIRQIRHEMMSSLKRQFEAKEIFEDEKKRLEKELQNLTDEMMAEIESIKKKKEEELSEI